MNITQILSQELSATAAQITAAIEDAKNIIEPDYISDDYEETE